MDISDDDARPPLFSPDDLDIGAMPASTDALRAVLTRHRQRQSRTLGIVAVVVLLVGAAAGFAIGNTKTTSTQLTAGAAPTTPTPAVQQADPATSSGGYATRAGSPIPSTQLLLRNATDGTRVRLYQDDISAKLKCAPEATCPAPPPSCFPTSALTAEVSDDQVAGNAGGPIWATPSTTGLDPISAAVVGAGQPQPILVALAHAAANVTKVQLTTSYGTDTQLIPAGGGWAALALQLPATFTSGSNGNPAGSITALSASGATISQTSLDQMNAKAPGPCEPSCPGAAKQTTATTVEANGTSSGTCACPAPPVNAKKGAPTSCAVSTGPGAPATGSVGGSGGGTSSSSGTGSGTTVSSGA